MRYAIDTSVLVDYLRGYEPAVELVERLLDEDADIVSSYAMRAEVLAGMRRGEERATEGLLSVIAWEAFGRDEADAVGALGRRHLGAVPGIDTPDLMLAEVAQRLGAELLTTNAKHFKELFPGIQAAYRYR